MTLIGLVGAIFIFGAIGFIVTQNDNAQDQQMMAEKINMEEAAIMEKEAMIKSDDAAMMDIGDEMKKDETMMDDDTMMKKDEGAMMEKAGTYTSYSGAELAMAQKGRTVLFFHAGWCPTCRSADADITKNLSAIPAGVTILKTDYDTEVALKQKYGVTTQHTFVEVDSSGAMVQKWSGGNFAGIAAKL